MTTPTKQEIVSRATELYMKDNENFNLPEVNELQEEGYLDKAKMELMCSPVTEKEFQETVDSVFAEMDQAKEVLAENEKLKEQIKKLSEKPQIEKPLAEPLSFVMLELKLTVNYSVTIPQKPKTTLPKIKEKRILKLTWKGFKWIVINSAKLAIYAFIALEYIVKGK